MKKIIISILFLLSVSVLYANRNMGFSIKNKISHYLNQYYFISNQYISFDMIEKGEFPDYKLYDIEIMNKNELEIEEKTDFTIKVSSFFDKYDYQIITVSVFLRNIINNANLKVKLNKNDKIRIVFSKENVKFRDIGTIDKIINPDILIVKNSFGHILRCRRISNELAEVIQ